jgi:hypothetical protein
VENVERIFCLFFFVNPFLYGISACGKVFPPCGKERGKEGEREKEGKGRREQERRKGKKETKKRRHLPPPFLLASQFWSSLVLPL